MVLLVLKIEFIILPFSTGFVFSASIMGSEDYLLLFQQNLAVYIFKNYKMVQISYSHTYEVRG